MNRYLNLRPNIALGLIFAFLVNSLGPISTVKAEPIFGVEGEFHLPAPGILVPLSPEFNPPILKGIKVHPDNPFRFDFILDQGSNVILAKAGIQQHEQLKQQSIKLIKYFLASLTIPEKDLWVNLSPYEKNRIVPESFGQTEMGRDLLAEDYMLKQITASLIYPEDAIGKKFWKRIYEEAAKKFGTTNIPVNTFNKVWIVPEKAVVYENAKAGTAYVVESKLKVMLEQDYLVLSHTVISGSSTVIPAKAGIQNKNDINTLNASSLAIRNETASIGANIVREIVIPELTKEVNENKNFAQLRQIYNSLILATWYKKKIKASILAQVYADKNKTVGVEYTSTVIPAKAGIQNRINSDMDPRFRGDDNKKDDVELIYQRYLQAFKKGAYNYIKEDQDPVTQQVIPRKYFSGGADLGMGATHLGAQALSFVSDGSLVKNIDSAMRIEVRVNAAMKLSQDQAMSHLPSKITNILLAALLASIVSSSIGSTAELYKKKLPNGFDPLVALTQPGDTLDGLVKQLMEWYKSRVNQLDVNKLTPKDIRTIENILQGTAVLQNGNIKIGQEINLSKAIATMEYLMYLKEGKIVEHSILNIHGRKVEVYYLDEENPPRSDDLGITFNNTVLIYLARFMPTVAIIRQMDAKTQIYAGLSDKKLLLSLIGDITNFEIAHGLTESDLISGKDVNIFPMPVSVDQFYAIRVISAILGQMAASDHPEGVTFLDYMEGKGPYALAIKVIAGMVLDKIGFGNFLEGNFKRDKHKFLLTDKLQGIEGAVANLRKEGYITDQNEINCPILFDPFNNFKIEGDYTNDQRGIIYAELLSQFDNNIYGLLEAGRFLTPNSGIDNLKLPYDSIDKNLTLGSLLASFLKSNRNLENMHQVARDIHKEKFGIALPAKPIEIPASVRRYIEEKYFPSSEEKIAARLENKKVRRINTQPTLGVVVVNNFESIRKNVRDAHQRIFIELPKKVMEFRALVHRNIEKYFSLPRKIEPTPKNRKDHPMLNRLVRPTDNAMSPDLTSDFREKVIQPIERLLEQKKKGKQQSFVMSISGIAGLGKISIGRVLKERGTAGYASAEIATLDTDDFVPDMQMDEFGVYRNKQGVVVFPTEDATAYFKYADFKTKLEGLEKLGNLVIVTGIHAELFLHRAGINVDMKVLLDPSDQEIPRLTVLARDGNDARYQASKDFRNYMFSVIPTQEFDLVIKDIPLIWQGYRKIEKRADLNFETPSLQQGDYGVPQADGGNSYVLTNNDPFVLVSALLASKKDLPYSDSVVKSVLPAVKFLFEQGNDEVNLTVKHFSKGVWILLNAQKGDIPVYAQGWTASSPFIQTIKNVPELIFAGKTYGYARTLDGQLAAKHITERLGGVNIALGFTERGIKERYQLRISQFDFATEKNAAMMGMNAADVQNSVFVNSTVSPRYFLLGRYRLRPTLVKQGQSPEGFIYAKEEMEEDGRGFNMWLFYCPQLIDGPIEDKFNDIHERSVHLYEGAENAWVIDVFYPYTYQTDDINYRVGSGGAEAVFSYLVDIARLSGVQLQSSQEPSFQASRFYIKQGLTGLAWPKQILIEGSSVYKGWQDLHSSDLMNKFFDFENIGNVIIKLNGGNDQLTVNLNALGNSQYKIMSASNADGQKENGFIGRTVSIHLSDFDVVSDGESIGHVAFINRTITFRGDNAMPAQDLGGIDLTPANMNLQTKMDSRFRGNDSMDGGNDSEGIKFYLDPAMLEQLQNATGFVPVIINIQPLPAGQAGMNNLREFLGLQDSPTLKAG